MVDMLQALYQRLKEIDSNTFEKLSFQILAERYPEARIRRVDGAGGDKGLDHFAGILADGPSIWQSKHFPNGVKDVQRRQVLKSLNSAVENYSPKRWTLMVPVDLSTSEHEWFQKLQSDYAAKTIIELFDASDFVRELIQRRNIRDIVFPGAVFDTIAFLRKFEGTGALDSSSLAAATNKYLEEEIARLEEADPRFTYRVSYASNIGLDVTTFTPLGPKHTASIVIGNKRIDVFVRDTEAARLDPPRVGFTVNAAGLAKLREFYRTGKVQQLGPGEMRNPTVPFGFALPGAPQRQWQVQLRPSQQITDREHLIRVRVSNGEEQLQYDLIKFRVLSAGLEEMELESISNLPFVLQLRLPLRPDGGGDFNFAERFLGYGLSQCARAIRLKHLLRKGAGVELHSLELDAPLGVLSVSGDTAAEMDGADRAVLDMAEVTEFFGWTIPFSGEIDDDELNLLILLLSIVRGTPMPIDSITVTIRKSEGAAELIRANGTSQLELAVFIEAMAAPLIFQGVQVTTGPLLFRSLDARFVDPNRVLERVTNAADDEDIEVQFSVGEIYAQRTTESIRNLYVRPIDGTEDSPAAE
jgi:hypothetical protein